MVPNIRSPGKVAYDKFALWGISHWREQRKYFYAFARGMQLRGDVYLVVSQAWEIISEIEHAFEDKQYQPEGILELFRKLHNDVKNIHEELAEYINTPIGIVLPSTGIPDNMCDVPFRDNSPPLDISKDQFEGFSDSNDDYSSSDDDSLYSKDIDYVDASPPDSELVSLEVVEIVIPEV
ncbi:hypothetical protein Tco_0892230 [Tanacetum coccineum]|uniref:Uncharacterized protein n=1 Tax=Tanacetum coccineum TaxID=301880 RepID=A0ABQ5C8E5_9ASTR